MGGFCRIVGWLDGLSVENFQTRRLPELIVSLRLFLILSLLLKLLKYLSGRPILGYLELL